MDECCYRKGLQEWALSLPFFCCVWTWHSCPPEVTGFKAPSWKQKDQALSCQCLDLEPAAPRTVRNVFLLSVTQSHVLCHSCTKQTKTQVDALWHPGPDTPHPSVAPWLELTLGSICWLSLWIGSCQCHTRHQVRNNMNV